MSVNDLSCQRCQGLKQPQLGATRVGTFELVLSFESRNDGLNVMASGHHDAIEYFLLAFIRLGVSDPDDPIATFLVII